MTKDGLAGEKIKFIPVGSWELKEHVAQRSSENLGLIYHLFKKSFIIFFIEVQLIS